MMKSMSSVILAMLLCGASNLKSQRVAFLSGTIDKQDLYIIDLNGKNLKKLNNAGNTFQPSWSPDGSMILFTRMTSEKGSSISKGHLCIIRPDGSGLKQMTTGNVFDIGRWSKDGKQIEFNRQIEMPNNQGIENSSLSINPYNNKISKLGNDFHSSFKSPNRKWIAYFKEQTTTESDRVSDIWIKSTDGRTHRRLKKLNSLIGNLQWSPDSKRVYLVTDNYPKESMFAIELATGNQRTILREENRNIHEFRVSPDGKNICYTESLREKTMSNSSFRQLYVVSLFGLSKQRLTNHWGNDYSPQWTRDGKSIVIQTDRDRYSGSKIALVSAYRKGERFLAKDLESYSPVLSP